jgi:D-glycero-alpha-D-manno-heptose 1-phosphate guanylyltransferase
MIHTAIILAGGFGTRLQSVVSTLPKPMAPVNGIPFLNYQLDYLKASGVQQVILSIGYLADKIISYYGLTYKGLSITYVMEETPLGTGGGIRLAMEKCTDASVLVLNGDSFFDVDLTLFVQQHEQSKAPCSLALRRVEDSSRYGKIETDASNRITSFKEKSNEAQAGTINGGVYLLDTAVYKANTLSKESFSIEKDFFEKQLSDLTLKGFVFDGYFIDIGIPEDYLKAQHDFKEFKYR